MKPVVSGLKIGLQNKTKQNKTEKEACRPRGKTEKSQTTGQNGANVYRYSVKGCSFIRLI